VRIFPHRSHLYRSDSPTVWLNGGPGCSSLQGLTSENGPLSFIGNQTAPAANPYSWTKLGYVLYVDQPVGVGYSTGPNQTADNFDVTQGFINWLKAFYAEFPELMKKTTYITGESYAGVYVSTAQSPIIPSLEVGESRVFRLLTLWMALGNHTNSQRYPTLQTRSSLMETSTSR